MKQTLPIWCCKQVKTNRIYCKHFLNHVLGGQNSSQHHMFTACMSVFAKSICFLKQMLLVLNIHSGLRCIYFQQHDQHDVSYYCVLAATAQFTHRNN